jgi:hypothetical protein
VGNVKRLVTLAVSPLMYRAYKVRHVGSMVQSQMPALETPSQMRRRATFLDYVCIIHIHWSSSLLTFVPAKTIKTGYCICNDPIINYLGDFFIHSMVEMGKILEKVMCPALMALDLVVEIGSMAIPGVGKAITVGMSKCKSSKYLQKSDHSRNRCQDGEDVQACLRRSGCRDGMGEYGKRTTRVTFWQTSANRDCVLQFVDQGFGLASAAGCKTPFTFSKAALAAKFVDFSDAPDELVPGLNLDEMPCPKGKKASKECKKKNGESEDEDPAKTGDNNQPTPTNDPQSSAVSSTSTSDSSVPTADCAAIGRKDQESLLEENPSLGEEPDLPAKRAVGSTLQSRRLEARKRGFSEKSSQPCFTGKNVNKLIGGMTIKSKKYPTAGDDSMVGRASLCRSDPRRNEINY